MKLACTLFVVALLTGCGTSKRLDNLESQVFAAQEQARVATMVASRSEKIATLALENSADAVEAVSRMAEKCCRK